jgi:hypothetical protein
MSAIAYYEKEFVERTRHILKRYKGKYKLSNAINCTLGLIVLPNEMLGESRNPIWDTPIADIDELSYLRIQTFEPIQRKRNGTAEYYPKTLKILLKKIRNGLAHQNIQPINTNQTFTGIIIRNYYCDSPVNSDLDLEIEFNREELENFGLFIAGKYLGD